MIDHGVALAAAALGVLVLAGLAVAGVRAFLLYRSVRRAQGVVAEHIAVITAEVERAQARMERVTSLQAELAVEVERLRARLAVARVLARHASEAAAVLRGPLRYLGR